MSKIYKLRRLFNTLRYLKPIQVYYRGYYKLLRSWRKVVPFRARVEPVRCALPQWKNHIYHIDSYVKPKTFILLNIQKYFQDEIDWEFKEFGKLWTYNLNYFEYLNQFNIQPEDGIKLIRSYIDTPTHKIGDEPYPISLRGVNWIKFLATHKIEEPLIRKSLYRDYQLLSGSLEYHLMGNHLLENAFSLLFAWIYFNDTRFEKQATSILEKQFNEQILNDGGHFELSTMYHKILLYRILDCIALMSYNGREKHQLQSLLKSNAIKMLGWLETVRFRNGAVPMLNDSIFGIAPKTDDLFQYAKALDIQWRPAKLSGSGYRMFENINFELLADFGHIGPDYQPGHAHADTFHVEMHFNGQPILVDTGTSTYEIGPKRQIERGTAAHNTVILGNEEQSEIWAGFRVGRRARVTILEERENGIDGRHNGYRRFGAIHRRNIEIDIDGISISDILEGKIPSYLEPRAAFHFHPDVSNPEIFSSGIKLPEEKLVFEFESDKIDLSLTEYEYAEGYKKTTLAPVVYVYFQKSLKTRIVGF